MYKYYNANPLGRNVHDCTVRAISLATQRSWDETYRELSNYAQALAVMPDDVHYIDDYLDNHFEKIYYCSQNCKISVDDFIASQPKGTYLITMSGHITCCIDGCIYDTFDPSERYIWGIYKVRSKE